MNGKWFLFLALLTLISIAGWMGLIVFQRVNTSVTPPNAQQIQPISSKFDTELIDQLENWGKGYWDTEQ